MIQNFEGKFEDELYKLNTAHFLALYSFIHERLLNENEDFQKLYSINEAMYNEHPFIWKIVDDHDEVECENCTTADLSEISKYYRNNCDLMDYMLKEFYLQGMKDLVGYMKKIEMI